MKPSMEIMVLENVVIGHRYEVSGMPITHSFEQDFSTGYDALTFAATLAKCLGLDIQPDGNRWAGEIK